MGAQDEENRMARMHRRGGNRCGSSVLAVIVLSGILVGWMHLPLHASHPVQARQGRLQIATDSELWGFAVPCWESIDPDLDALFDYLKPMVERGVNAFGFALQVPGRSSAFFLPDGKLPDDGRAERFTHLVANVREIYLATVIELFSADPSCWLESADAYHAAARSVAGLLPRAHTAILVLGDLAHPQRWPSESPIDLNDPEVLIALCREIHEVRRNVLVGIPARFIENSSRDDLLYVSNNAQQLAAWIDAVRAGDDPAAVTRTVAPFKAERFLRLQGDRSEQWQCRLECFADEVHKLRLASDAKTAQPDVGGNHPAAELSEAERAEGFELLFDGRTLEGWTTLSDDPGGWSVQDGMLYCEGVTGPWLRTRKRYGDFVLRLEFKISDEGNSGVFIRAPLVARASRFGMEMQILGVSGPPHKEESTGAIYDVLAPTKDAARPPGTWNEAEIDCRGSRVKIRLNGELVLDFDMDQVDALKNRLRCGVIGLQDHNDEVWFRNIRIKTLDDDCRP